MCLSPYDLIRRPATAVQLAWSDIVAAHHGHVVGVGVDDAALVVACCSVVGTPGQS